MDYTAINANTEEGFQDLEFSIEKYFRDEYDNHIVRVYGQYNKEKVGFEVAFRHDMSPGTIDGEFDNSAFFTEGVNIYSIGEDSNRFISALAEIYRIKGNYQSMANIIRYTSFCLEGNPQNFTNEDLKFKVFYDDNDIQGLYSEIYININIPRGILELKEKDIEYRKNIIYAFSGKKNNKVIRLFKKILKRG